MLTIHVPEDISFLEITPKELPAEWRDFPHPMNTQRIGDKFVAENRQCIMIIPSVITQCDFNVLINPNHPEFKRIRVISTEKFPIDKRLFK
jgi:RES domain-containing protein